MTAQRGTRSQVAHGMTQEPASGIASNVLQPNSCLGALIDELEDCFVRLGFIERGRHFWTTPTTAEQFADERACSLGRHLLRAEHHGLDCVPQSSHLQPGVDQLPELPVDGSPRLGE